MLNTETQSMLWLDSLVLNCLKMQPPKVRSVEGDAEILTALSKLLWFAEHF